MYEFESGERLEVEASPDGAILLRSFKMDDN